MFGGGDPFYLKFWANGQRWSEIADFRSIFARSASAVTPSEKTSITLVGSPLYELSNELKIEPSLVGLGTTSYVVPKPTRAERRKVSKI